MPFTVSHAAAAFPLRRILGRHAVWSALIIGTFMPDLPYFLPLGVPRHVSHSELGLLYYCVPCGLLAYLLFHKVMKVPLAALLPAATRARLPDSVRQEACPAVPLRDVVLSILLGAGSHLAWDAFTHGDAMGVALVPVLVESLFEVGDYALHGYAFLQHASTIFGLVVLAIVIWRWHRQTAATNYPEGASLQPRKRVAILAMLVLIPGAVAITAALATLTGEIRMTGLQRATGASLIAGLRAFGVSTIVYCVLWRLHRRLYSMADESAGSHRRA